MGLSSVNMVKDVKIQLSCFNVNSETIMSTQQLHDLTVLTLFILKKCYKY